MGAPAVEAIGPHPRSVARAVSAPATISKPPFEPASLDDRGHAPAATPSSKSKTTCSVATRDLRFRIISRSSHSPCRPPHRPRERQPSRERRMSAPRRCAGTRAWGPPRLPDRPRRRAARPGRTAADQHPRIDRLLSRDGRDPEPGVPQRGGEHVDRPPRRHPGSGRGTTAIAPAGPFDLQAGECRAVLVRSRGGRSRGRPPPARRARPERELSISESASPSPPPRGDLEGTCHSPPARLTRSGDLHHALVAAPGMTRHPRTKRNEPGRFGSPLTAAG